MCTCGNANPDSYGAELIRRERERQIFDEGYTLEKDDVWIDNELTRAAVCYAANDILGNVRNRVFVRQRLLDCKDEWPWQPGTGEDGAFKPTGDRVRDLIKAGALIAAEIDRLLREDPDHELIN